MLPNPSFPAVLSTFRLNFAFRNIQNIFFLLNLDFDPISINSCFINFLIIGLDVQNSKIRTSRMKVKIIAQL
jgi:hypothetical protein